MRNKKIYLEVLRCLALVFVVLIHVVAIPIQNWTTNPGEWYPAYSLAYTIGNFGVPLFLMISGALLCNPDKSISLKKIYSKMIPRILVPLAFFGYCYALLEILFETHSITISMFGEAVIRVLNEESWGHLWYMYLMIGIYLMLPIVRFFFQKMDNCQLLYTMIVLFIMGYLIPTINTLSGLHLTLEHPSPLCHLTVFMMGYVILKFAEYSLLRKLVYICGSISIAIMVIYSLVCCLFNFEAYTKLAQYNSVFVFASVSMIFLFFVEKKEAISKIFGGGEVFSITGRMFLWYIFNSSCNYECVI